MSCDLSRRSYRIRKLPCRFRLYLRVEYRPFPLRRLVGLFRCRFDQCNVQACALAACTASVISTNAFAYLPGLHAARPSAFVKGGGVEPPAHLSPVCANYSGFFLPYVYPDFLLSLVILKTSEPRGGLAEKKAYVNSKFVCVRL